MRIVMKGKSVPKFYGRQLPYELYLRYYQQALEYCGHPYAYTCIGSAFAVRAADYVLQGGMNKRQAGKIFISFKS